MIADAVEQFLSRGGKVQQVAGFEYKPLPAYKPPKKRKARGPGGRHLHDRDEALEAIERIKAVRSGFAPATKDVDETLYRYASYAKKQRDKIELSQDWGELDK